MLELSKIYVVSFVLHRKVTNAFQKLWEFEFYYCSWNKISFCIEIIVQSQIDVCDAETYVLHFSS